jgi:2-methylisocitrate lyase-like PEP mutase family enzyme
VAVATQAAADRLRALHAGPAPLLLVNAWDAATARIAETLGFPAIATTSSGVSNAEGVPDGGLSREQMLARIAVIAAAVKLPVSADLEAGYGPTVDDAVATARGALAAGAVGLNFEDATGNAAAPLFEVARQSERIRAIRAAAPSIVINARTDAMRHAAGTLDEKCDVAIARGKAYLAAGADCVFVPFITDERIIGRLAAEIPGPINILAMAESPPVARLAALGVRRISLGGAPAAHALAGYRRAAQEVLEHGTFGFAGDRLSHAELSAMLA